MSSARSERARRTGALSALRGPPDEIASVRGGKVVCWTAMETEAPEAILRMVSHRKSRIKAIDIHPEDMIMSKGAFSDILNIMKNIFTFL